MRTKRTRPKAFLALVLVLALPLAAGAARPALSAERLVVAAAASTLAPLNAAVRAYGAAGVTVVPIYASSGTLARQILAGSPARVFIAADRKWMDAVAAAGRVVDGTRRVFAANALVLAVRADSPLKLTLAPGADLAAQLGTGRLVTADPQHAPLGRYARAALTSLGAWDGIAPRLLRAADAAQARVMVERGGAAAGILYASDIAGNPRLRRVAAFPRASYPAPVYEIAVVAPPGGGNDLRAARAFADWLMGPGQAVFGAHGFLTAAEAG